MDGNFRNDEREFKQWGVISHPIPGRSGKPRSKGITMVMDKGLGLGETRDILEVAHPYVDLWKMGFGTSMLYPHRFLREKIAVVSSYDVYIYFGGTLLEIAYYQRKLVDFLTMAKDLGICVVEVSDGTLDISEDERGRIIDTAISKGFFVLTEAGKKNPIRPITAGEVLARTKADLGRGAWKVILEGRDSGRGIGIYDVEGNLKEALLEEVIVGLTKEGLMWDLIFEAPQPHQQRELLLRLGLNVNLGNVNPRDVITLEAMRVGLRSDTFRLVLNTRDERQPALSTSMERSGEGGKRERKEGSVCVVR
ncbi:MAG TPA: phosphosulfolactate synthase [Clostridia bacterium]|nr:phosphosulfolactate synthase [Clostridia bacterium]